MNKYALIGKSLSYSQSRKIHALIGDYDINHVEAADPGELSEILHNPEYSGFSITNPYKVEVLKYLDELSPDAERIGSVNVVKKLPDGRLMGCNTDIDGFKYTVQGLVRDKKCLILGTGGSAMACAAAIDSISLKYVAGCIAGDDTIFCAVKQIGYVNEVMEELNTIILGR